MHFLPGKRAVMVVLAVAALLVLPLVAQATLFDGTYEFTEFNVLGYTGPFVSVHVVIDSATNATITETALSNYWIDGGKNAINFNFNTDHVVTVTPPNLFTREIGGGDNVDGYGSFNYRYEQNRPQYPGTQGPVTFNITGSGFTSDILSLFALNAEFGKFMCAAIGVDDGSQFIATGFSDTPILVSGGVTPPVPLPAAFWLIGAGLVRLGLYSRRKGNHR
jgi:hypothetical protein